MIDVTIHLWPDLQKRTTSVKTFVTWFVKNQLLKHLKKQFFMHTVVIYAYLFYIYAKLFLICFIDVIFDKSGHKCFDRSGLLLQIRSHLYMCIYYDGCICCPIYIHMHAKINWLFSSIHIHFGCMDPYKILIYIKVYEWIS